MEIKTCFDDVNLEISPENLIIEREDGFLTLATYKRGGGIRSTQRIVNKNQDVSRTKEAVDSLEEHHRDAIISNIGMHKILHLTSAEVTVIIIADKTFKLNYIILLDSFLDETSQLNIFKAVLESKMSALSDYRIKRSKDISTMDELMVAGRSGGAPLSGDEVKELGLNVREMVKEASYKLFRNMGYPLDILGYIENTGVNIPDLIEAGMELVVGVERTDELDYKLKRQILKSLDDLNVATLIMAGIRLEEDLSLGRIRGIDVEDDPAYLYSDEVLGMAIANQIAGTKAIFNFKRYDEEKPGILGKLGPMLDDVFAGLIAGCMSRVFEE